MKMKEDEGVIFIFLSPPSQPPVPRRRRLQ